MKKSKWHYDKESDCLYRKIDTEKEIEFSRELKNVNIIVDFDEDLEIVGIEIEDFRRAIKKSDDELKRIFSMRKKK